MPTRVVWNGAAFQAQVEKTASRRITAACMLVANSIRADISQPGTLRSAPGRDAKGRYTAGRTVYNFTHSRPGNPPYKQTGEYRASIRYEVNGLVGRVGSNGTAGNPKLGLWLELGTHRMKARPHIVPGLMRNLANVRRIVDGTVMPGDLGPVVSNQSRPGHLGAGARAAGYL